MTANTRWYRANSTSLALNDGGYGCTFSFGERPASCVAKALQSLFPTYRRRPKPLIDQMKTEAQFIHERCIGLIRKSAMNESHWEMTLLGHLHEPLIERVALANDEYSIVSFFAGEMDWTVYTTNRLIGAFDGLITAIPRLEFGSSDFGDFKQDVDSPRVTTAFIGHGKTKKRFLYESGYASMAPIYYFRFWKYKWPVWIKTFALESKIPNKRQ